ncbi:hypothetical protein GCM10009676_25880 [Prauserella halophila]|uniref:Uncharacterized protein n=1 Tax=Prauserella halophila TaxID=185641 RepID=A0ABN1WB91_9PSEU|nr:hypothetical protein [Prauserella halophila]MCP2234963.1 hypothetical protein [Prauserella halophila]
MESSLDTTRPKAPARAYVLMVVTGLALAAAVGLLAATLRSDDWWPTFAVFAATTAGPLLSLTWLVFVARYTVRPDSHRDDNAESRWLTEATSSAFHDLVIMCGIALFLLSISGIEVGAAAALSGVLVVAAVDTVVRYQLLKRRAA